jgi:alpha-1,2-mannosyltransferase
MFRVRNQPGLRPATSGGAPEPAVGAPAAHAQRAPRGMVAVAIAVFVTSIAALAAVDAASPGQRWFMLDLQIYRWAGHVALHSGDLYGTRFPHYHLRFTYPPMAALVFAGLSAVPMTALKWLVTAGSIAFLTATLWLTTGLLGYKRSAGRIGATLAATGVALWLQPVQQTLGFGQVNIALMLVIVADFALPEESWLKGAGIGLAAGFKLTPLVFVPFLLLTRRFRAAGVAVATFALTIAVSLVLAPGLSRQFWFGGLFLDSGRTGNNRYVGNQSLNGTLARLLGGTPAAQPYWLLLSVAVGTIGLLIAAWWARRGHVMTGVLVCALTGLLVSPISWTHHWVWAAPALVVAADLALRLKAPGWRWWAYLLGAAALAGPFFASPQNRVPASVVQGTGARGIELVTSNLYVITGLAILCAAGLTLLVRGGRRLPASRGRPRVTFPLRRVSSQ